MISSIFRWFEGLTEPLPTEQPEKPPETLFAFVVHYARPFWPLLLASSLLAVIVALIEVSLFAFFGNLVDWLGASSRATPSGPSIVAG